MLKLILHASRTSLLHLIDLTASGSFIVLYIYINLAFIQSDLRVKKRSGIQSQVIQTQTEMKWGGFEFRQNGLGSAGSDWSRAATLDGADSRLVSDHTFRLSVTWP